jgi:hypothetical protein
VVVLVDDLAVDYLGVDDLVDEELEGRHQKDNLVDEELEGGRAGGEGRLV